MKLDFEHCKTCGKKITGGLWKVCKGCGFHHCQLCIQYDGFCDACHYKRVQQTNDQYR